MKVKEFINTLKKRIVLIPLGTLAAIATIVGVVHAIVKPERSEVDNIVKEYIDFNTKLNRYQLPDSMISSNQTLRLMEEMQDEIELYVKTISKLTPTSSKKKDIDARSIICQQNLMILIDCGNTVTRCRNKIKDLILTSDSLTQKDLEQYISYGKLESNVESGTKFNEFLKQKCVEISNLSDKEKILYKADQILTSDELANDLAQNKNLFVDLYDSINILKRKYYQRQSNS